MKKYSLYSILTLFVVLFSCESAYDITQDGEFSNQATFKTVADMNLFLNEVYDQANIIPEIGFTSVFTDEVGVGSQNAGQNADLYRFFLPASEGNSSAIWLNHYRLINYANRLIEGAQLITPSAADLPSYNSIIAEARTLRAFGHFQLLTYFSTDLKNNNALGVILMDRVPNISEELPRSTNGQVFTLIDSDLLFAQANLIDRTGANAYKFLSQNMIKAFKARMYAYRGDYGQAFTNANDVITSSGISLTPALPYAAANFYLASSTNPYRRMLADLNQGEVIFALDRPVSKGAIGSLFFFNQTNEGGGSFHDMGRNLFNLIDAVPGDIRLNAYIDPTATIDPSYLTSTNYKFTDKLLIDKYPGKTGAPLNNDLKVFRLSEMYFIRAESYVNAGNLTAAALDIQSVRNARNRLGIQPLPVYANPTDAWADILKERRIELCYEGHRYIDLKRLGVLAGNLTIDRNTRDCDGIPVCSLPTSNFKFTLPIPLDEIIGNATISTQQNPGY